MVKVCSRPALSAGELSQVIRQLPIFDPTGQVGFSILKDGSVGDVWCTRRAQFPLRVSMTAAVCRLGRYTPETDYVYV